MYKLKTNYLPSSYLFSTYLHIYETYSYRICYQVETK